MTEPGFQQALRREYAAREHPPAFGDTWHAARNRQRRRRRGYQAAAGVAAAVAAVAIIVNAIEPDTPRLAIVEKHELLGTTSWQAPSDILLPDHRIDLYEDLPTLIESTEPAEGALL